MDVHQRVWAALLLDPLHQIECSLGFEQSVNVLHADGIATQFLYLLRYIDECCDGVHWTRAVGQCTLCMLARLLDGFHAGSTVPDVVQCVEDPEHVNTVSCRFLHESADDGVIKVPMGDHILPAQQHLQPGFGQ